MYKHLGWCECMFSVDVPASPEATWWASRLHQSVWFWRVREETSSLQIKLLSLHNKGQLFWNVEDQRRPAAFYFPNVTADTTQNIQSESEHTHWWAVKMGNKIHTHKPRWRWKEKVVTLRRRMKTSLLLNSSVFLTNVLLVFPLIRKNYLIKHK